MPGFDDLLERVRTGQPVEFFGELMWDGETRQTTISVRFSRPGSMETDLAVCERAWRYLRQFTTSELSVVKIRVFFERGRPERAIIEPRSGAVSLGTARLREMQRVLLDR